MPSRPPSILIPVLTGLLSLSLAACAGQPTSVGTTALPEIADPESLPVYHEASLAERPGLVAEAEKPLVLQIASAAPDVVPLRYVRGIEEEVRWEGAGDGAAELHNEHGQLIYRVTEGGEPFTGLIPAGRYTLTVSGGDQAARTLVVEPTVGDTRQQRAIYWQPDGANRGAGLPRFHGARLKDLDFSGRHLMGTRFTLTRLEGVSFAGADLTRARFDRVVFKNCNFDGAKLASAGFERSMLIDCSFEGARMVAVDFDYTDVYRASMRSASLWGAYFHRSRFSDVAFEGADLRGIRSNWTPAPRGAGDRCANYPGCGFESVADHFKAVLTYHR